jgi:predicted nucleotidyltransferase component of viral defense system
VNPLPHHGDPAGDARIAIRKLARTTGRDNQELLTLYALEGLLARIAASDYADDFVLKGGALLAAYAVRRSTKDIDLQATHLHNEIGEVAQRISAIASIHLPDGLVFDPNALEAQTIREDDEYEGVRVRLQASLGSTRLFIGVDVNFGDPIWPEPARLAIPTLVDLGHPPVVLLGYPLAAVLGEKLVTMIQRGEANTRWRDFADVYLLTHLHSIIGTDLTGALGATANHRGVQLTPLGPLTAQMPDRAQPKWARWRAQQDHGAKLPEAFADVLEAVTRFADPVLDGTAAGLDWEPAARAWGPASNRTGHDLRLTARSER